MSSATAPPSRGPTGWPQHLRQGPSELGGVRGGNRRIFVRNNSMAARRTNRELEEAHHSTAIEGNTLVLKQVEILLEEGRSVGNKELREYLEVRGYADAANWVYGQGILPGDWQAGDLLSLAELRQVHTLAMTPVWDVAPHPRATPRERPGAFREHDIEPFPEGMQGRFTRSSTATAVPVASSSTSSWFASAIRRRSSTSATAVATWIGCVARIGEIQGRLESSWRVPCSTISTSSSYRPSPARRDWCPCQQEPVGQRSARGSHSRQAQGAEGGRRHLAKLDGLGRGVRGEPLQENLRRWPGFAENLFGAARRLRLGRIADYGPLGGLDISLNLALHEGSRGVSPCTSGSRNSWRRRRGQRAPSANWGPTSCTGPPGRRRGLPRAGRRRLRRLPAAAPRRGDRGDAPGSDHPRFSRVALQQAPARATASSRSSHDGREFCPASP